MFEKLLKKLGYVKSKKLQKKNKQLSKAKQKGKWSEASKKASKAKRTGKKWRKANWKTIYRKRHTKNNPSIHFSDCPACNDHSSLTWEQYVIKVQIAQRDNMIKKAALNKRNITIIKHRRVEKMTPTEQEDQEYKDALQIVDARKEKEYLQ